MKQMRKEENNERPIILIYVLLGMFGPTNDENCLIRFRLKKPSDLSSKNLCEMYKILQFLIAEYK